MIYLILIKDLEIGHILKFNEENGFSYKNYKTYKQGILKDMI